MKLSKAEEQWMEIIRKFEKRQGIVLSGQGVTIVLLKEKITPHSFGNYLFINREDYENKQIANEIITHESLHISQRHFLDIIFMELLIIFKSINSKLHNRSC